MKITDHTPPDRQPVANARLSDLDLNQVQQHIAAAQERGRYGGTTNPTDFLLHEHCLLIHQTTLVPTIAGLLAFAHDPEQWLPGTTGVDLAQFTTAQARSTTLNFIEQVRGSLFSVVDRTAELLWARSDHDYRVADTQRVEEHAYPRIVLRELTVNAICHRDWILNGRRVQLHLLPATLTWTSPGSLPDGVTVENILSVQQHRNPTLAKLLFQAGYIEGFGLGLNTVWQTLLENQNNVPVLENTSDSFSIRVAARSFRPTTSLVETAETRQRHICVLLQQRGPMSIVDIAAQIGVSRRTLLRDLNDLIDNGRVAAFGATRNLRYGLPLAADSRQSE